MPPRKRVDAPETSLELDDGRIVARWSQAPEVHGYRDPHFIVDPVLGMQLVAIPTGRDRHVVIDKRVHTSTGLPIAAEPQVIVNEPTAQGSQVFSRPEVVVDPFSRDRYGRPMIQTPSGETVAYTRASRLASFVDDDSGLAKWRQRMTALGLSVRPDLVAAVQCADPADRGELSRIADEALEAGGGRDASARGTAIHRVIEQLLRDGVSPAQGPDLDDARAGVQLIRKLGLEALGVELAIVNHELRAAGTADLLARGPSRVLVVDHKTSGNIDAHRYGALSWAVQCAVYAGGVPYIAEQGSTTWEALSLPTPDRERALVVHIQQGASVARAYSVDLVRGFEAARLATQVRDIRSKARELLTAI